MSGHLLALGTVLLEGKPQKQSKPNISIPMIQVFTRALCMMDLAAVEMQVSQYMLLVSQSDTPPHCPQSHTLICISSG